MRRPALLSLLALSGCYPFIWGQSEESLVAAEGDFRDTGGTTQLDTDPGTSFECNVEFYYDRDGDGVPGEECGAYCVGSEPNNCIRGIEDGWGDEQGYIDCDDNNAAIAPGLIDIWDGINNDCQWEEDDAFLQLHTDQPDRPAVFGPPRGEIVVYNVNEGYNAYAMAANLDGDANPELVIGEPSFADTAPDQGRLVTLLDVGEGDRIDYGGLDPDATVGEGAYNYMGAGLVLGDVAGDGLDDILSGMTPPVLLGSDGRTYRFVDHDGEETALQRALPGSLDGDGQGEVVLGNADSETVWVYDGATLASGDVFASSATATISFANSNGELYLQQGSGDLDGDGAAELLVGQPRIDYGGAGAAYLFEAPAGAMTQSDAVFTLDGNNEDDQFGSWVAMLPDLDGDGLDDFAVVAFRESFAGVAHLYTGVTDFTSVPSPTASITGDSFDSNQELDFVQPTGDVDGDGNNDLYTSRGLLAGPFSGDLVVEDVLALRLQGVTDAFKIQADRDVNGDGKADLVVNTGNQIHVVFGNDFLTSGVNAP